MLSGTQQRLALALVFIILSSTLGLSTAMDTGGKPSYVDRLPEDRKEESCNACHIPEEGEGEFMVNVHQVCTSCHFISTLESLQIEAFPVMVGGLPEIDGVLEPAWSLTTSTNIKLSGGELVGPPLTLGNGWDTLLSMKALFTPQELFLAMQWDDETEDAALQWAQDNVTGLWELPVWRQMGQDKLALLWETTPPTSGFLEYGCLATCHLINEAGTNSTAPLKYTSQEDEVLDLWYWMAGLSNPFYQAEDQFVNSSRLPPLGGRFPDGINEGGNDGYYPNLQELSNGTATVTVPKYVERLPSDEEDGLYLTQAEIDAHEAVLITGVDALGDLYYDEGELLPRSVFKPAYIITPFSADRGDITARGIWDDGVWTVELSRPLLTDNPSDVQFYDLETYYLFGLAVFDNAGMGHAYHPSAFQLNFRTEPAKVTEEPENTDWLWASLSGGFFVAMFVLLVLGLVARNMSPQALAPTGKEEEAGLAGTIGAALLDDGGPVMDRTGPAGPETDGGTGPGSEPENDPEQRSD